jgi:predicted amidohydrolase YtcJ
MQGIAAAVADLLPPPDGPVDSIAKLQAQLKAWGQTPAAARLGWIMGNGYDDTQLKEQRHPTRQELDTISTTVPILAIHQSGHMGAVNSKALELANMTAATPDPTGGVIRREAGSKEPNGVLEESAMLAILSVFSKTAKIQAEDALSLVQQGVKIYIRNGFTTAQEGRSSKESYDALRATAATNSLPIDVAVYPDYVNDRDAHTWGMSSTYTKHLRLAGIKISTDGSVQGYTAWMTQPFYKQPPGQVADYRGYAALTDEQLMDRVESAYKNNVQAIIHGNGDAAIDQIIMAVRKATDKYGKGDRRTVLIHGQTVREDQLDACKQLGIVPALFPSHVFYWGDWHREMTLGPERAARISPTRSVLNRGMKVTIHADAPVVIPSAMRIMWAAVNRRTRTNFVLGKDEALTPLEALKAQTLWSAYQHFEENQKGSIEVGKLADFAVLSANPLTVDPMTIKDIQVVETIKEGKSIYKAGAAPA